MCWKSDLSSWRQIFILLAGCLHSFGSGMMLAHTAVLNPAILSPNATDIKATPDQASWIAASNGLSGILGFFILTPIFQNFGRKPVNICISVVMLSGWIILTFAENVAGLFASRIIQGTSVGGVFVIAMSIGEYVHAKRRGYFLALKKVSLALGSLTCHSLTIVWTWRQIASLAILPTTLTLAVTLLWPESPAYLALKGRFDECEKAYFWLNGKSAKNKKELQTLILLQSQRLDKEKRIKKDTHILKRMWKQILRKDFLKPCLIVSVTTLAIDACGRFFLLAYITQIIVEITDDKSIGIYCSIALDCLLILALSLSCILVRCFKRRTLLFTFGSFTVLLMFMIGLVMTLQSSYNTALSVPWLVPFLVLFHGFIAHVSLIPVCFAISSEVFPLEHRGVGSCISGVLFSSFYAFTMKLTPVMIENTGVQGTYAIYGLVLSSCLLILYYVLPETKDRTLQDIENELKGVVKSEIESKLISLQEIAK